MAAPSESGKGLHASTLGRWLGLTGYLLVVLGPILVLLVATVRMVAEGHFDWLLLMLPAGRRLALYLNSVGLALGVSVVALLLGWMGAVLLWSRCGRVGGFLAWLALPLAALPPSVHAMAWLALADALTGPLGSVGVLLRGWAGAGWVQAAASVPLTLGCAWLGLHALDPDLVEAGRIARSDLQVLLRVALPMSAPALLAGGGMVFVLSLLDYTVPSLFQVHVYAMEIFAEFSASSQPERAFLLALPLLVLAAATVAAILEPMRTLSSRLGAGRAGWASPPHWPVWTTGLLSAAWLLLLAQVLSPFLVMAWLSRGLPSLVATLKQAQGEVGYSLWTAGLAAVLCLPFAATAARFLAWRVSARTALWYLVLAPVAIPASLVGIGLVLLSNHPWMQAHPLALAMPSLASVVRFTPLAALVLLAQLRRRDPLLLDAARVFQPSRWRRQVQVSLPLAAPGLLAGAGLVFALAMGELGATLMVIPPGHDTLTLRIYNYLHYGASDTVAGLSLLLAAGVLAAGVVAAVAGRLWTRMSNGFGERP